MVLPLTGRLLMMCYYSIEMFGVGLSQRYRKCKKSQIIYQYHYRIILRIGYFFLNPPRPGGSPIPPIPPMPPMPAPPPIPGGNIPCMPLIILRMPPLPDIFFIIFCICVNCLSSQIFQRLQCKLSITTKSLPQQRIRFSSFV